jgi:hypothetical protein
MMEATKMTKEENELLLCNEILGVISNLEDADEAREYIRLYLKAEKVAAEAAGEEFDFDKDEVWRLVREVDERIK